MSAVKKKVDSWLEYNTKRIFLTAAPQSGRSLTLAGALNETISFQVAYRLPEGVQPSRVVPELTAPEGWMARIRRVGHVPVRHRNTHEGGEITAEDIEDGGAIPGYVPDVLYEDLVVAVSAGETHAFWVTLKPGAGAVPGTFKVKVRLSFKEVWTENETAGTAAVTANVRLYNVTLPERRDFSITHWFYADSLLEWYRLKPFEPRFWEIAEAYIRDYVAHGLDTLYVPAFTPPLDGVKRPTQLVRVAKKGRNSWQFDWTDVEKWIDLARACGIKRFEWVHLFSQWGVRFALRIYEGQGEGEKLLWPAETPACSPLYRKFLTQFLGELHDFMVKHDILDKSYFHVSDEPHGDEQLVNYQAARTMLKEIAPWMKTMDALTDIEFGRRQVTDMPVPSIATAVQFYRENIESWCYYCCGPRGAYLNRLLDTPLAKVAMHGILFYRWPFKGFLHWGFNYWFRSQTRELIDVFEVQDGYSWPSWAYGDTTQVYPGPDGRPLDSIRWEVFSESLQDYQLLQLLDFSRDSREFKDIRDFNDFPKNEAWHRRFRLKLLKMAEEKIKS